MEVQNIGKGLAVDDADDNGTKDPGADEAEGKVFEDPEKGEEGDEDEDRDDW